MARFGKSPLMALLLVLGCSGGASRPAERGDVVLEVVMDQGGACVGNDPCWWKTTASAPGVIRLESATISMEAPLPSGDWAQVGKVVAMNEFRKTIESPEPLCPVTFDAGYVFALKTSLAELRDPHASGCILDDARVPPHPYRVLFTALDGARRRAFPGVLPF